MKNLLLILLCFCAGSIAIAQDVIINMYGDTIVCHINSIDKNKLHYRSDFRPDAPQSSIALKEVVFFCKDCYREGMILGENQKQENLPTKNFKRWSISASAGYSVMDNNGLEYTYEKLNEHINSLHKGLGINLSAGWQLSRSFGFDFHFQRFSRSLETKDLSIPLIIDNEEIILDCSLINNVQLNHIGIDISGRFVFKESNSALLFGLGAGPSWYTSEQDIKLPGSSMRVHQKLTGSTLSAYLNGGGEIGINNLIALSIKVTLVSGTIDKVNVDYDYTTQDYEAEDGGGKSIMTVSFMTGLVFRL